MSKTNKPTGKIAKTLHPQRYEIIRQDEKGNPAPPLHYISGRLCKPGDIVQLHEGVKPGDWLRPVKEPKPEKPADEKKVDEKKVDEKKVDEKKVDEKKS